MHFRRLFPVLLLAASLSHPLPGAAGPASAPRERPAQWAPPVIGSTLENCFRVSDELYRCEQPGKKDIADLKTLGIRSIFSLRHYHTDSKHFELAGFQLFHQRLEADELTVDNLVAALRLLRTAPKPLLVHCWHGSDRTGAVVAAYRIVFQEWTPAEALDELRHGGFGYHEKSFPNIITLFQNLDAEALRKRVLAD